MLPKADAKGGAAWLQIGAAGHYRTGLRRASSQADRAVLERQVRVGQKGRVCHNWWLRGRRPWGVVDQRYALACAFTAVEPATGHEACVMLPEVSTAAKTLFLSNFSPGPAPDEHADMVLDGAGRHTSPDLAVAERLASPVAALLTELKPVERAWLYLRERHLSHRLYADNAAVLDAACAAWRKHTAERLQSLCDYRC